MKKRLFKNSAPIGVATLLISALGTIAQSCPDYSTFVSWHDDGWHCNCDPASAGDLIASFCPPVGFRTTGAVTTCGEFPVCAIELIPGDLPVKIFKGSVAPGRCWKGMRYRVWVYPNPTVPLPQDGSCPVEEFFYNHGALTYEAERLCD